MILSMLLTIYWMPLLYELIYNLCFYLFYFNLTYHSFTVSIKRLILAVL